MGQQCMTATNQKNINKDKIDSNKNTLDQFKGFQPIFQQKPNQKRHKYQQKQEQSQFKLENDHNNAHLQIPSIYSKSRLVPQQTIKRSCISSKVQTSNICAQIPKGRLQTSRKLNLPPSKVDDIQSIKDSNNNKLYNNQHIGFSKLTSSEWVDDVMRRPTLIDTDFKSEYFNRLKQPSLFNNDQSFISNAKLQQKLTIPVETQKINIQSDKQDISCQCDLFGINFIPNSFKKRQNNEVIINPEITKVSGKLNKVDAFLNVNPLNKEPNSKQNESKNRISLSTIQQRQIGKAYKQKGVYAQTEKYSMDDDRNRLSKTTIQ